MSPRIPARWLAALFALFFLGACASGPSNRANTRPGEVGDDTPKSLSGGRKLLDSGLESMEIAYKNVGNRRLSRIQFDKAINNFKQAQELYLNELAKASEMQTKAIEKQLKKISGFLRQCHRDRPIKE